MNISKRQDIQDLLKKRLVDFKDGYRQNIAILGDELTGKTTLLKNFIQNINDEKIIPIYVDVIPFEFSLFLKRFLDSFLYNTLKKYQLVSTRENLDLLAKRIPESLPRTREAMGSFLAKIEKDKPETLFRELFAIIEIFGLESQKKCLIVFDEFHHLKKFGIKNICQELGKKIMLEKNTLFVFASSSKTDAKEILANDLALLFGNFETIELKNLDPSESRFLIKETLENLPIPEELNNFLIHFTGGHPFYLKTICQEALKNSRSAQKPEITKDILTLTLEELFFNDWGILNLKFSSFVAQLTSTRNKNEFACLLSALALGKNRMKDLTNFLRRPKAELSQKLNRLIEQNIISKNGTFFTLNDRLLSFWLRFVHYEKLHSLSHEYSEQTQHFRANIHAEIEEFIDSSKRNIADRMFDLFNLFEDDDILIEKKRFHLTPFKELRLITFDETNLKVGLFGKSQGNLWLAAIKEEGINEQDINDFLQSSKKFKNKTITKLIIGLGDIERNARLLAKESRILTWDIASINNIFDLYGKPRIIPPISPSEAAR